MVLKEKNERYKSTAAFFDIIFLCSETNKLNNVCQGSHPLYKKKKRDNK
jgi:hypothetical protein